MTTEPHDLKPEQKHSDWRWYGGVAGAGAVWLLL